MIYVGADNTEEAVVRAAEALLACVDGRRPALVAAERLRQVLLNYERRKLFSPRSSVEQEQAASIRTVGGSNPSGGTASSA